MQESKFIFSGTITHRFPNPDKYPEQFKSWVTLVGGKLEKSSDYEYHKKRIICDKHFKNADKNRNHRLNRLAVPSLHLPEQRHVDNLEISHATQPNINEQASTSNLQQVSIEAPQQAALPINTEQRHVDILEISHATQPNINEQASTSNLQQVSIEAPQQAALPTNTDVFEMPQAAFFPQFQSLSTPTQSNSAAITQDTSAAQARAGVIMEHNYSVISKSKWAGGALGGQDGLKTKSSSTSLAESISLRTKIKRLRTEIIRLQKKSKSFAARLANAEDLTTNPAFQDIVNNMTKPARLFIYADAAASEKNTKRTTLHC
ncbi:uncharacterized protein LOC134664690 [Cydia fagiglandana]|uniref:uncharacterized protein LOC134664690 n=2 Tax=Cydia fagiglandana TaxID=1458189 RepID=UPI002FEE0E66